ncbi:MAG TPA: hypothetical protein VF771_04885 [Longimicrobiaceae bacterium]
MSIEPSGERDLVAARGEALFCVLATRQHATRGFLFDIPRHLGEKKRSVDYFVELFEPGDVAAFFLAQVKTTREGYTRDNRLKVAVSRADLERLATYPAPTYVVGIDIVEQRGYIVAATGATRAGFSSMCTDYPLTPNTLAILRDEVEAFGQSSMSSGFRSRLADPRLSEP